MTQNIDTKAKVTEFYTEVNGLIVRHSSVNTVEK